MDEANRARALAGNDDRVLFSGLVSPTVLALRALKVIFSKSDHRDCFLQLLLKEFQRSETHLLADEVLYSEFDSAQLDGVKLLDLVILYQKVKISC